MARFITKQKKNRGEIPGKPVFVGHQKEDIIKINLIGYDEAQFIEFATDEINDIPKYAKLYKNLWVNIHGIHDVVTIKEICALFNIHTLLIEDIVNTSQRAKNEIDDDYIFTIMKMMFLDRNTKQLVAEQISMYVTDNVLLTFQEKKGDIFDPIRERLRTKKGRVRTNNVVYLKYCLLDMIVNNYFFLVEIFGNNVEDLEDKILLSPSKDTLEEINKNKIELNYFKKNIRPAKDAISNFKDFKSNLISQKEQPFYNDLNDLIYRVYETLENYKNMLSEQLIVYSTNINHRLNDIIKLLTMFSVVFIPITFIAGVYGTNFDYLPELKYQNAYFVMWGVIILTVIAMIGYFKYKKWI